MKKVQVISVMSLLLVSATASAISFNGSVGRDFTHLGVGLGTETGGLFATGQYTHNDDEGETAGAGLGFNLPLGPLMLSAGGKAVYLNPKGYKDGYALAAGGGINWPVTSSVSVFGDYYYSPDSLSSHVKDYREAMAGVSWTIMRPISLTGGYRYSQLSGKRSDRTHTVADGAYVGVSARF